MTESTGLKIDLFGEIKIRYSGRMPEDSGIWYKRPD